MGKEVGFWRDKAQEVQEAALQQMGRAEAKDLERKNQQVSAQEKAAEALLNQERIGRRWQEELRTTVETYERLLAKARKDNRELKARFIQH